jgi:hypothetical protein
MRQAKIAKLEVMAVGFAVGCDVDHFPAGRGECRRLTNCELEVRSFSKAIAREVGPS